MKTRHEIALAIILGVTTGIGTAITLPASIWWLGLIVGMGTAFLSYRFRETHKAAVEVAQQSCQGLIEIRRGVAKWAEQPRPFHLFFFTAIALSPLAWILFRHAETGMTFEEIAFEAIIGGSGSILMGNIAIPVLILLISTLATAVFKLLTEFGAEFILKRSWRSSDYREKHEYEYADLDYENAIIWAVTGCIFPVAIVCAILALIIIGIGKFFRKIHCHERLICAFDTGLATVFGYLVLYDPTMTCPEVFAVFIASATIGALLGVANYELVSKRWFKLV